MSLFQQVTAPKCDLTPQSHNLHCSRHVLLVARQLLLVCSICGSKLLLLLELLLVLLLLLLLLCIAASWCPCCCQCVLTHHTNQGVDVHVQGVAVDRGPGGRKQKQAQEEGGGGSS